MESIRKLKEDDEEEEQEEDKANCLFAHTRCGKLADFSNRNVHIYKPILIFLRLTFNCCKNKCVNVIMATLLMECVGYLGNPHVRTLLELQPWAESFSLDVASKQQVAVATNTHTCAWWWQSIIASGRLSPLLLFSVALISAKNAISSTLSNLYRTLTHAYMRVFTFSPSLRSNLNWNAAFLLILLLLVLLKKLRWRDNNKLTLTNELLLIKMWQRATADRSIVECCEKCCLLCCFCYYYSTNFAPLNHLH